MYIKTMGMTLTLSSEGEERVEGMDEAIAKRYHNTEKISAKLVRCKEGI